MRKSVSEEIINKALVTYLAKDTRYVTQAEISDEDDFVKLFAKFAIKESCYLFPNSGHFNAVEALMCFNQMLYVVLLAGIKEKLFPFYTNISPDEFNKHRRKVYILELENIKFKKQIDNNSFCGFIEFKPLHKVGNKMYVSCRFGFGGSEKCADFFGNVKVFVPILG